MLFLRALAILILFVVICSTCNSVILRPRWYPYFKKEGDSSSSGQVQLTETSGARQARTVRMEPCQDTLYDQNCNTFILMAIRQLLNREDNQN
nr:hypothetical protein BgiMline_007161 [Biomphalaria glabrata]